MPHIAQKENDLLLRLFIFFFFFFVVVVADLTTLRYTEAPPPMSQEKPKHITTTIMGYDQVQLRQAYKSQLMGIGMMLFMHVYLKYTNPLLIQSIIPLKSLFENKLVQIHLLGKPATGELARPWKVSGGMFGGFGGEPKTDKRSVEGVERKGTGGAKE